jgi:rod shape-determining protein MreB and related proteins
MFGTDFYVRIARNLFRVKNLKSGQETQGVPEKPFTTVRMLVGEFTPADQAFKAAFEKAGGTSFMASARVLMHPLEMVEGGLSQIEDRVLQELALGGGAKKCVVWIGAELSDAEVAAKLGGK